VLGVEDDLTDLKVAGSVPQVTDEEFYQARHAHLMANTE
jgi:hypothetical protein